MVLPSLRDGMKDRNESFATLEFELLDRSKCRA